MLPTLSRLRDRTGAVFRRFDRALRPSGGTASRARIGLLVLGFAAVYGVIALRLVHLGVAPDSHAARRGVARDAIAASRPDILDRSGRLLATDIKTASLYGVPRGPRRIVDVDEAVERLSAVLSDLDQAELRERLEMRRRFVWLRREITPAQQAEIHRLGLPGIGFLRESKRVYPAGPETAHILGHVNIDNAGIAGLEKWIDGRGLAELHQAGLASGRALKPVELALELSVQHAVRDELQAAKDHFKAIAAAGLVLDVRTGEIVSMASLPDYDPNRPGKSVDPSRLNRLTTGVYEMGSTFKALTVAMALDSGKVSLSSSFDARAPLHYGNFKIDDFHPQRRVLSVPEAFIHSSNIASARMALAVGVEAHRGFLRKMGQLERLRTELPESAEPLMPKNWSELSTVTIAYGHGLSVAPLQAVMATAALVNGGYLIPPTFLKRTELEALALARPVIKAETSGKMRYLLRLNVEKGTASRAEVDGYYVGGKTGTSEKVVRGRYAKDKLLTTFMGVFPADKPRYLLFVMLDEPQPAPETKGFATSGYNAVPTAGRIIARVAPLLGLKPRQDLPSAERLLTAARRAAN
jgi:cell division protein FtsI (penicillin-binding protein 3)